MKHGCQMIAQTIAVCLGILSASPSMAATSSSVSIRLVAVVPEKCSSHITHQNMQDRSLTLSVNRNCNTEHRVRVSNLDRDAQDVLVHYQNRTYPLRAHASINIPASPASNARDIIAIQPVKNASLSANYALGVQLIPNS